MKHNPWDVTAGKLLVEKGGGAWISTYAQETLANNGRIHEEMIEVFKGEG